MRRIAVITLGTLEIKMDIAEISSNGKTFILTDEYREPTKIIEDFEQDTPILKTRLNEIVSTLTNYKTICNSKKVEEVFCFAENNYKNLKNEHSFFEQINSKIGYRFLILSDKEYIDYMYTAVVSSMNTTKGLFVHICENRTYLVQYNRRVILNQLIIPFGYANNLGKLRDFTSNERYEYIEKEIKNTLFSVENKKWINELTPDTTLVLQGDVFKNISKLIRKQIRYPFDKDQNFATNKQDLLTVCDTLQDIPFDDSKKLKGTTYRADAMSVASLITKAIINNLQFLNIQDKLTEKEEKNPLLEDDNYLNDEDDENIIEEIANDEEQEKESSILVCEYGLTSGLLFKTVLSNSNSPYKPNEVLEFSLSAINNYYNETSNSEYVCKLSGIIFKQLKVLHRLNRNYLTILKIASSLYDSGARINPKEIDKYSYYTAINSPIFGVGHREILLAGFVLMSQNNDNFLLTEWAKYRPIIIREGEDELEVKLACQRLAVILKLARAFDRYSNSRITDITCDNLGKCVIMKTTMSVPSTLEIREAKKIDNEFRKVFNNKKIEIL